jgi:hypothetical protein
MENQKRKNEEFPKKEEEIMNGKREGKEEWKSRR